MTTVKELIEKLKQHDPAAVVQIVVADETEYRPKWPDVYMPSEPMEPVAFKRINTDSGFSPICAILIAEFVKEL